MQIIEVERLSRSGFLALYLGKLIFCWATIRLYSLFRRATGTPSSIGETRKDRRVPGEVFSIVTIKFLHERSILEECANIKNDAWIR